MHKNLPSKKQRELLSFIDGFIKGNGYGPSYREIMRALDYKSVSTVAVHVNGLIAKGYLDKRDNSARSLEVIPLQESGKNVEKPVSASGHEAWLETRILAHIKTLQSDPSPKAIHSAHTLVDSLKVLGLKEAHANTKSYLDSLVKQLDQTGD